MKAKTNADDVTPEEEAAMTVLADIIIDSYLAMTHEERKAFIEKSKVQKKDQASKTFRKSP